MPGSQAIALRHGPDTGDASVPVVPDADRSVLVVVLMPHLHGAADRVVALPRPLPRTRLLPDRRARWMRCSEGI
jgi:hypothetical protein